MNFLDIYLQTGWLLFPLGLICLVIWLNITLPLDSQKVTALPQLQRRIAWVKALTTSAPLLGLLGTVLGLMQSFQSMAQGQQAVGWSNGIAQALLTTELGLMVSIPGILGVAWLRRRERTLQHRE